METIRTQAHHLERSLALWLAPYRARLTRFSVDLLRLTLGVVFLLFGVLKFIPGLSPAEDLATQAMRELTFGMIPPWLGLLLVALLETTIGVTLLTGHYLRLGLLLLGAALVGILSPLVLFPGELFAGPFFAPTLEGQYVIKDIVLVAAALVVAVKELAQSPAPTSVSRPPQRRTATPRPGFRLDLDARQPSRG